ncbi:type III pantothenate kinase [Thalassotalea mangrovi]|uniref:type III pantothenate kinase n=1 Tax=Thalassotalea mangrovi TaxID=2572245 RepID=UPI00145CAC47|nr:type III pantothenate kinase [Thalassotalea mangrovi]
MIILVDVGNSRIKLCELNNEDINAPFNSTTADADAALRIISVSKPSQVLVSAVSDEQFCERLQQLCKSEQIIFRRLGTASCNTNIQIGYQRPEQLGVDRWMAVIGAQELFPNKNLLVVDAGTATTFDLLSADNRHLGGWITPGINMMISALYRNTTQVRGAITTPDSLSFADNTSDNVNHGCWSMTVGAIQFAKIQAQQLGVAVDLIVLTGGNGEALLPHITSDAYYEEKLIFIGMAKCIDLNR